MTSPLESTGYRSNRVYPSNEVHAEQSGRVNNSHSQGAEAGVGATRDRAAAGYFEQNTFVSAGEADTNTGATASQVASELLNRQPVEVASTAYLGNLEYGAGPGNRLIPVRNAQGQKWLSQGAASDALAEAYGLGTQAQKNEFRKLGLFPQGTSVDHLPNGAFMPVNISAQDHANLRKAAANIKGSVQAAEARREAAAAFVQNAESSLRGGEFSTNRQELWNNLLGAGVDKKKAEELLKKNDQNVGKFLQTAREGLSTGSHYDNLSKLTPDLVKSNYLTQDQAQRMLDRNWLNWATNALRSGSEDAPSLETINNRGYEIISRADGQDKEKIKSQVQQLKDLRNERDGRPTSRSAPLSTQGVGSTSNTASTAASQGTVNTAAAASTKPGSELETDSLGLPLVSPEKTEPQWADNALQKLRLDGLSNTPYSDANQPRFEQGREFTILDNVNRAKDDFFKGLYLGRPGNEGGFGPNMNEITEQQANYAGGMSFAETLGASARDVLNLAPAPFVSSMLEAASSRALRENPFEEEIRGRTATEAAISSAVNLGMDLLPLTVGAIGARFRPGSQPNVEVPAGTGRTSSVDTPSTPGVTQQVTPQNAKQVLAELKAQNAPYEQLDDALKRSGGTLTTTEVYSKPAVDVHGKPLNDAQTTQFLKDPANWHPERVKIQQQLYTRRLKAAQQLSEAMKANGDGDTLIAAMGNTAAGKTTAMRTLPEMAPLAKHLDGAINPDPIKADMVDLVRRPDGTPTITTQQAHKEGMLISSRVEQEMLKQPGSSVLFDKRFAGRDDFKRLLETAEQYNKSVKVVDIDSDLERSAARVLQRKPGGADPLVPFDPVADGFAGTKINRRDVLYGRPDSLSADGQLVPGFKGVIDNPRVKSYDLFVPDDSGQMVRVAYKRDGVWHGPQTDEHKRLFDKAVNTNPYDAVEKARNTVIDDAFINKRLSETPPEYQPSMREALERYKGQTLEEALNENSVRLE